MRKHVLRFCPLIVLACVALTVLAAGPDSGPSDFTAKAITAESLTVKAPGSKASVSIIARRDATGIWVESGKGTESVGLVVQPGVEPYFVINGERSGYPPFAITADGFQFCGDGKEKNVAVLPFSDLLKATKATNKPVKPTSATSPGFREGFERVRRVDLTLDGPDLPEPR